MKPLVNMPLPYIKTVYLIKELETDGHRAMKFLCNDGAIYYCKYRISMKKEEIDFLGYEMVCNRLLKSIDVPSPDLAIVEIEQNSYDPKDLTYNKRYVSPGTLCFGSKELPRSDLVTGIMLADQKQFNTILNPEDLIKIAIFDLWVDNTDRGRNENYNLLIQSIDKKNRIVPIDQAFAFGGQHGLRAFNPAWPVSTEQKLIQTSYFQSVVQFVNTEQRLQIAMDTLNLARNECTNQIQIAFADMPAAWEIPSALQQRMINFLISQERHDQISTIATQQLNSF